MIKFHYFSFQILLFLFIGCKTQKQIPYPNHQDSGIFDHSINPNFTSDTIKAFVKDTIVVELLADFSNGLIWNEKYRVPQLILLREDERQSSKQNARKDFHRFHYIATDTGTFNLNYQLNKIFGNDSMVYDSKAVYLIIQNK